VTTRPTPGPTLRGVGASDGVVIGPWRIVEPRETAASTDEISEAEVEDQVALVASASLRAATDLEALADRMVAEGHPDEAGIFFAQAVMSGDPTLTGRAVELIRGRRRGAGWAVLAAGDELAGQLRALDDALISARAADVLDVAQRIAAIASGSPAGGVALDRPCVVVASDLAPSVTATLPRDRLLGLALERGSATAHAAILARAYGIPAVVGADGVLATAARFPDADVGLDGTTGEVFVDPDLATLAELHRRIEQARAAAVALAAESDAPATTIDGCEVTLLANIGSPAEATVAAAAGARGIGLFRTEFLFVERAQAPTEDEQVVAYRAAIEALAPYPVTIRLLDVGGDKPIPYLPVAPEANPFLGVRALRLAVARPALFVTQLRAARRAAAHGPLKVMAPMVADRADVDLLIELDGEARAGLVRDGLAFGEPALGIMLEIPAAVIVADTLLPRLAFASLGTNDLLQYLMASDRGNPALDRYHDPLHPALLRTIADAVRQASGAAVELSVCGEMAGDPIAALALIGLGVRSLSMAPSRIGRVRRAIRGVRLVDLETEAGAALREAGATPVRAGFSRFVERTGSS